MMQGIVGSAIFKRWGAGTQFSNCYLHFTLPSLCSTLPEGGWLCRTVSIAYQLKAEERLPRQIARLFVTYFSSCE